MRSATAISFHKELESYYQEKELDKLDKFYRGDDDQTKALGIKFGDVFKTAKKYVKMPLVEIEELLESEYYEVRMGAMSIMDFQVQQKNATEEQCKALFDLYLNRHDRIDNWDLVDRAAKRVIGSYLYDFKKDREILCQLANSKNVWERRTAIVATSYFITKGELEYTFNIAEILIEDKHDLIQKAVGGWIREAGKRDKSRLVKFLDEYAGTMPRTILRYATEKLDPASKKKYRS